MVVAETKDHANWELIGECAQKLKGPQAKAIMQAYEEVEDRKTSTPIQQGLVPRAMD